MATLSQTLSSRRAAIDAADVSGLGTAATTASTDYATAAQGATADTAYQSSDLASQAQAETGTNNTTLMTPLRTAEAINALTTPPAPPQCIQTVKTDIASTTSDIFVDLGMSVTITPTSTDSKVLISFAAGCVTNGFSDHGARFRLQRGTTTLAVGDTAGSQLPAVTATYAGDGVGASFDLLDAPSTTSAVTYKVQWSRTGLGQTTYLNRNDTTGTSGDSTTITTLTALEVS